MNNPTATNHGYWRLQDRTKLPLSSLQQLIKSNLTYPLGREGNKVHSLFYSYPDDDFYVVIVDEKTEEIISVMGKYWHPTRCFYDVNTETMRKTKELVIGKPKPMMTEVKPVIAPPMPIKELSKKAIEPAKYFIQSKEKRITTFKTTMDINDFFLSEEFKKTYLPTIVGSMNKLKIPKATPLQYVRSIPDVPFGKLKKVNCPDIFRTIIKKAGAYEWQEKRTEEQIRKKLYENYHKHLDKMKEVK